MTGRQKFVAEVIGATVGNLIVWPILHLLGIIHICSWGGCS